MVHECGMRGIRLLPVLTNGGSNEGGGMKQYIDWIDPALTVADFYKNDTIKVRGLQHHVAEQAALLAMPAWAACPYAASDDKLAPFGNA